MDNNELIEELTCLRKKIVETEINLSKLHADIYHYREEVRNIRLMLPLQDELQTIQMTDKEKLKKKKHKLEKLLEKLHKKINKKYQQVPNKKTKQPDTILYILLFITIGSILFLFGWYNQQPT